MYNKGGTHQAGSECNTLAATGGTDSNLCSLRQIRVPFRLQINPRVAVIPHLPRLLDHIINVHRRLSGSLLIQPQCCTVFTWLLTPLPVTCFGGAWVCGQDISIWVFLPHPPRCLLLPGVWMYRGGCGVTVAITNRKS